MRLYVRRGGGGGIPWWLIVGALGFIFFGGWKGFFGAIAGVILIPIAFVFTLAIAFFIWMHFFRKKFKKGPLRSPFAFEREEEDRRRREGKSPAGDVIETEGKVIMTEKDL